MALAYAFKLGWVAPEEAHMTGELDYFELAADALRRAMTASNAAEQGSLLEEAVRFNRLALAEERAKLALMGAKGPPEAL